MKHMDRVRRLSLVAAAGGMLVALAAASLPPAMLGGGLWEVSRSADGHNAEKVCLPDPGLLMQWEHRKAQCTRVVVFSTGDKAEVHYTCVGGGFGTSKVQVITPRSLRINTQGISGGYPFGYTVHARRMGAC